MQLCFRCMNSGLVRSSGVAGAREIHCDLRLDPAGTLADYENTVTKKNRLIDVVGDKDDRHAKFLPEVEQHLLHLQARLRIQRTERSQSMSSTRGRFTSTRARAYARCMPPESLRR